MLKLNTGTITAQEVFIGGVAFWLGMLVFRLSLDFAYQYFLSPIFKFDSPINFHYLVFSDRYILSLIVFLSFVLVLRAKANNMSDVFMFMSALFLVAPMTSEYGLNAARPFQPVAVLLLALLIVDIISRVRIPDFISNHTIPAGRSIAIGVSVAGVIYLVLWGHISGAAKYLSFDLTKIYSYREKITELLDVGVTAYLNLWVYKVFTIFLICISLQYKKYLLLFILIIIQIYFFGLTSHRIVLFLPLMPVVFWLYLRRFNSLTPMPYMASVGICMAIIAYEYLSLVTIPEIIIRRAFFVPTGLVFQWFDYFNGHAHVYWADRILSSFSDGAYVGVNIPRLIGDYLVPGSNSAANSGMIASGYAHAGYLGVILYSVILGLVVSGLNSVIKSGVPLWVVAALSMGPLRTAIADSDLFTSLLSHGLGLTFVILWLYRGGESKPSHS